MANKISQRLTQLYNSKQLPWIIMGIAIVLRLLRYLSNTSLYFDEADTAVDIIGRSFAELIEPSPDWSSKYPYGHLLLIKLVVQIFGNSEYSLRLVALFFGILSVFLFFRLAKKYINPAAVPVALCLFAVSEYLIFQSSNLKPFSGDMAFAMIIILGTDHLKSKKINMTRSAVIGLIGAIIIWFSHPSLFVLAGSGISLVIFSLRKKEWSRIVSLSVTFSIWALSFIACYFIYIRHLIANFDLTVEDLVKWEQGFIPFPPTSLSDIKFIMDRFFGIFDNPVGLSFTGLAAFAFFTGCIYMFRNNRDKFVILISPVLVTILASILHQYPFKGRLIVFLIPFIFLFIAEGIEYIREKISVDSVMPGLIILGIIFAYPLSWAAYHAKTPSSHEEIKPVIRYIKNNWQDGDIIYVHYYAQYAFEYYTKLHPDRYTLNEDSYTVGIAPRGWYRTWRKQHVFKYYSPEYPILQTSTDIFRLYIKDLNKLKGNKRVWVLFSSIIVKDGMQEEKFFVFHLDTIGKKLDSFGKPGISAVYLYDLSEKAVASN